MTDTQWDAVAALFTALIETPEADRDAFWDARPNVTASVKADVLALLAAHQQAEGYLEDTPLGRPLPVVGTRIGAWRLLAPIGQGGMSVVYAAERVEGGYAQRAAIKLIALPSLMTPDLAQSIRRRFEAERQIIAQLDHPDICRLLDGGITSDGIPYLVLEYVEGVDLLTYTSTRDLNERLAVLARVARAVHFAHQRLVVHRDLKPGNVLVSPEGHPKLLDFGIAKALEPGLSSGESDVTRTVHRAATPAFASPEQLHGGVTTTATDVYSLGLIVQRVCADRASADVDAIVARATRPDPGDRYGSASDLADDLDRCRRGAPVEARLGTWRYVVGKFVRRHAVAVGLAGLAAAMLLAFAVVTRIQMREVQRERERATEVASFLRSLFEASDPEVNRGNRLTTRQLLDEGAARIRVASLDAETRRDLLETMADAYAGLGVHESANAIFEELLPGARHDAARASLERRLALGTSQLGRHDEADRWALRAIASAGRAQDPAAVALAWHGRCLALTGAARTGDATPVCAQAAAQARTADVPIADRIRVLRDHGDALKNASQFGDAEGVLKEALALAEGGTRAPQPAAATTRVALGSLYFRQGKFDEAAQAYEAAIAEQRRLYPDGHADLARSLNNLANLHATMRRVTPAIALYTEAHTLYRRYLGDDHGELATSMSNLAVTQQLTGQYDDAAATLERVAAIHERTTGPTRLPYWSTRLKLVSVRIEQERSADAVPLARTVLAGLENVAPTPTIERGLVRVMLATGLIETGRPSEAIAPAREGRAILERVVAPTHWMRSYADMALGGALAASGQQAEGRRLLEPHHTALPATTTGESWRARWLRRLWQAHVRQ